MFQTIKYFHQMCVETSDLFVKEIPKKSCLTRTAVKCGAYALVGLVTVATLPLSVKKTDEDKNS